MLFSKENFRFSPRRPSTFLRELLNFSKEAFRYSPYCNRSIFCFCFFLLKICNFLTSFLRRLSSLLLERESLDMILPSMENVIVIYCRTFCASHSFMRKSYLLLREDKDQTIFWFPSEDFCSLRRHYWVLLEEFHVFPVFYEKTFQFSMVFLT